MSNTTLSNLPHFTFYQDHSDEQDGNPVNVRYYNGSIDLEQDGHIINITPANIRPLLNSILKNMPEAERMLSNRKP